MKIIKVKRYDTNIKSDVRSAHYFKHESIRPVQYKILSLLEENYNYYDNIFIEAQTGVGKSAIADAIASWRRAEHNERSAIIVNRKQLLHQYKNNYGHFIFMGKNEYPCYAIPYDIDPYNMNKEVSADMGACKFKTLDFKCKYDPRLYDALYNDKEHACPYYYNKNLAVKSDIVTTSSLAMLFNVNSLGSRDLLIWDEADSSFEDLIKFYTSTIKEEFYFKKYKVRFDRKRLSDVGYWDVMIPKLISMVEQEYGTLMATIKYTAKDSEKFKYHYRLHSLSEKLNVLSSIKNDLKYNKQDIVIRHSNIEDESDFVDVEFLPLSLSTIVSRDNKKENIFDFIARKRIFIGATLFPELLVRELNLNPDKSLAIKIIKHPYPVQNRMVYALSVGKMSKNHKVNTLPKLLNAIEIIANSHGDEPGIILPNSKWLLDEIVARLMSNRDMKYRVISHSTTQKSINDAIHRWNQSDNGILVSTYLKQGFDGSHGSFVIIPKVPFPHLGDEWVRRRKNELEYGDIEYKWKAIKDIIQMQGRCTRSATDKSIIYILDSDFNWMFNHNKELFYDWFIEAINFVPISAIEVIYENNKKSNKNPIQQKEMNIQRPKTNRIEPLIKFE